MSIAVVGGTGHVGSIVTADLVSMGHTPRIVSRQQRRGDTPPAVEWAEVNYKSGTGLAEALKGVEAAVLAVGGLKDTDVVRAVIGASPRDLRLIYLSIVGIDRLPMSYYRAKLAAEGLIRNSGRPWTILRATQFHSLAWRLLSGLAATPPVMFVPRLRLQPVAIPEVARRLAELAVDEPVGFAPECGGPEIVDLAELAGQYLTARGKKRRIVRFTIPGKLKAGFAAGANLTPNHADGTGTFADYARARMGDHD